jgi:hypothetical protein
MWYYLKAYSDWWGKWRNSEVEKADNSISEMIKTRATQQNAVIDRIVGEAEKAIDASRASISLDEEAKSVNETEE